MHLDDINLKMQTEYSGLSSMLSVGLTSQPQLEQDTRATSSEQAGIHQQATLGFAYSTGSCCFSSRVPLTATLL